METRPLNDWERALARDIETVFTVQRELMGRILASLKPIHPEAEAHLRSQFPEFIEEET